MNATINRKRTYGVVICSRISPDICTYTGKPKFVTLLKETITVPSEIAGTGMISAAVAKAIGCEIDDVRMAVGQTMIDGEHDLSHITGVYTPLRIKCVPA